MSDTDTLTDTSVDQLVPSGTHAAILETQQRGTGLPMREVVVWADRPYGACPNCGQPVDREVDDCPVALDEGAELPGGVMPRGQQHGCGEWLRVAWVALGGDATGQDVRGAADDLARALAGEIDGERDRIRRELLADLAWVVALDGAPLDAGETCVERRDRLRTGDDLQPGTYFDADRWVGWAYDPDGSGDVIEVTEATE